MAGPRCLFMEVPLVCRLVTKINGLNTLLNPAQPTLRSRAAFSSSTVISGHSSSQTAFTTGDWTIEESKMSQGPRLALHQNAELLTAFFSSRLGLSDQDIILKRFEHPYVFRQDLQKTKRILDCLLDNGVPKEDILKDMWIFQCSDKVLLGKVEQCKRRGIDVATGFARSSWDFFLKPVRREAKNPITIPPYRDKVSYLADRLNCSEDDIRKLTLKRRELSGSSVPKLERLLRILYEAGYTPEQVRSNLGVLNCSVSRVRQRLEDYKEIGGSEAIPCLHQLISSQWIFDAYLRKLNDLLKEQSKN